MLTGLGIDEYLVRTDSTGTRDLLSDALGSTVGLADSSGTVQTEYSYEPFGAATASGSSSTNELRYTGREEDGIGLNYYRARYYHPGLQRFISEDPIGFGGGDINLYAYVLNEPTSFRDSTGLAVDPVSWTAAAIMCGSGAAVGAAMAGRKATWNDRLHYAGVGCAAGMLTLVSFIAAAGAITTGVGTDIALTSTAVPTIAINAAQLQSKFKHAADFGISGRFNTSTRAAFDAALRSHVADRGTQVIEGAYHGSPAVFYTNVQSRLTVITDQSGAFISGWQFSPQQMHHLLTTGKVGGG